MTNGKTPLWSGALLQREEQAHQRTEARCVGLIDSQDLTHSCAFSQEKLRMAQEQMRRAETHRVRCQCAMTWGNPPEKNSIIPRWWSSSCSFFKTILYKWCIILHDHLYPTHFFVCRPVINSSRRHAGWDTPERVGVWGGQVRIRWSPKSLPPQVEYLVQRRNSAASGHRKWYFLSIEGQLGPRFGGHFCENHQDFQPSVTRSHVNWHVPIDRRRGSWWTWLMKRTMIVGFFKSGTQTSINQQGLGRPQVWDMFCEFVSKTVMNQWPWYVEVSFMAVPLQCHCSAE